MSDFIKTCKDCGKFDPCAKKGDYLHYYDCVCSDFIDKDNYFKTRNGYCTLAVEKILRNNPRGLTIPNIIEKLKSLYDIDVDSAEVFSQISKINYFFNIGIEGNQNNENIYFLNDR